MAASWGLPWQFVLAQLTNANLASSRAALDMGMNVSGQNGRLRILLAVPPSADRSLLSEAMIRGYIPWRAMSRAIRGRWLRPRQSQRINSKMPKLRVVGTKWASR